MLAVLALTLALLALLDKLLLVLPVRKLDRVFDGEDGPDEGGVGKERLLVVAIALGSNFEAERLRKEVPVLRVDLPGAGEFE